MQYYKTLKIIHKIPQKTLSQYQLNSVRLNKNFFVNKFNTEEEYLTKGLENLELYQKFQSFWIDSIDENVYSKKVEDFVREDCIQNEIEFIFDGKELNETDKQDWIDGIKKGIVNANLDRLNFGNGKVYKDPMKFLPMNEVERILKVNGYEWGQVEFDVVRFHNQLVDVVYTTDKVKKYNLKKLANGPAGEDLRWFGKEKDFEDLLKVLVDKKCL